MNQALAGSPDSPRTMLSVVWSGSPRSVVKRSDGPNASPTDLTVVPSPLCDCGPGPNGNLISRSSERHRVREDGVLDVQWERLALLPRGEVVLPAHRAVRAYSDLAPSCSSRRRYVCISICSFNAAAFAPGIELPEGRGLGYIW